MPQNTTIIKLIKNPTYTRAILRNISLDQCECGLVSVNDYFKNLSQQIFSIYLGEKSVSIKI